MPIAVREIDRSLSRSLYSGIRSGRIQLPRHLAPDVAPHAGKPRVARRILGAALRWIALAHAFYILATSFLIVIYSRVDPPVTVLYGYRKLVDGWKMDKPRPVRLAGVSPLLRRMVVAVEDGRFYSHWGLDFEAFERAIAINKRIGSPMYGGSTLTMQTARTLFLVPFKSYLRKYLEVIVTLELELILPKDRILELYLSWAEWGKGVFGADAAARRYYGIPASRLDFDQSARIAALLSSPIRFTPATVERSGILHARYNYLVEAFFR